MLILFLLNTLKNRLQLKIVEISADQLTRHMAVDKLWDLRI